MERIVVNRSATLRKTFYVDGVATDPTGTPTVAVTRLSDGTAVTAGAVTNETDAGTWSVTIPATDNTTLDTLTVTWTGVVNGTAQQYVDTVEVAGGVLFNVDQARTALGDASYDIAKISDARTYAETELEGALGYALFPRYEKRTSRISRRMPLRLRPYIRAIRSVMVDSMVFTQDAIDALTLSDGGLLSGYQWAPGYATIVVGYEHGLDEPPPGAANAALSLAVEYLGGGGSSIDPRAESIVTVDGTIRLRSSSGQYGASGVNEWIAANRIPAIA